MLGKVPRMRRQRRAISLRASLLALVLLAVLPPGLATPFGARSAAAASAPASFDAGWAGFTVKSGELSLPYRVMALSIMPGERLTLSIEDSGGIANFDALAEGGELETLDAMNWEWQAPMLPGLCSVSIVERDGEASMRLNIFVLVPYARAESGYLNGYRLGYYPFVPLKDLEIYQPPDGFIEVTPELMETPVSPHFKLAQFVCKQEGDFPKYMLLRTRLLLKLELVLAEINTRGIRCESLAVLSGFRTPDYNERIENVRYSRHVWGGAADVFVDVSPMDGVMDDLDGNGRSNFADARYLYGIIDSLYGEDFYEPFVGGLGQYRTENGHGPFVHVDVRGFRARWGD